MNNVLLFGYDYDSRYGDANYSAHVYIPSDLLQQFTTLDLTQKENLEKIVEGIKTHGTIWLGEVEGKHSEVVLDNDEFTVELWDEVRDINLDWDTSEKISEMLINVLSQLDVYIDSDTELEDELMEIVPYSTAPKATVHKLILPDSTSKYYNDSEAATKAYVELVEKEAVGVQLKFVEVAIDSSENYIEL